MNATAPRVLWSLAVLLALGVAAELAWPRDKVTSVRPGPLVVADTGVLPSPPVQRWVAAALARPVFTPTRRPDAPGAEVAAADPVRPEPPRLAGILMTPSGRRAIFAANLADGRAAVVSEGGAVGPWRVEAIHAGDVLLAGPDGRRTVRPAYSDAPPPAPKRAADTVAAGSLLPPLPPADTRPFNATPQPSGADIFLNAPGAPAARTSR